MPFIDWHLLRPRGKWENVGTRGHPNFKYSINAAPRKNYRGTPNSDSRLGPEASPVPLQPPLPQGVAGALAEADTHSASPAAGAPGTPDTPSVPELPQLRSLEEMIGGSALEPPQCREPGVVSGLLSHALSFRAFLGEAGPYRTHGPSRMGRRR